MHEETSMSNNPVGWFEIYVQDTARAKSFYEAVLGTRLERLPSPEVEMWAFPMQDGGPGAAGALVNMPGFPSGGNSTIVYFTCTDCAMEAKRAAASGGKVFKDKFSIGTYGFIALVTDTEGNMIGLHSMQ
jgi:predicted enzyme related to lactoylglutathione lyase